MTYLLHDKINIELYINNMNLNRFTKRIEEVGNFLNATGDDFYIFSIGPVLLCLFLKLIQVFKRHAVHDDRIDEAGNVSKNISQPQ